ncbi:hypothetical protein LIER_38401 [Lithospermum erythrorhizon]|uniref:Reverse transcriptase domain-containing protein n=1 Tax=Lithospermum erythrorhizon TaxID=34254 RepID=A0AAV3Q1M2_LITER
MEERKMLPKPQKHKAPPNRQDQKRYCEYHSDHGHDTDECRVLKEEIEKLIKRENSKEFVPRPQIRIGSDYVRSPEDFNNKSLLHCSGYIRSVLQWTYWATHTHCTPCYHFAITPDDEVPNHGRSG